jgi:CysZ protein
MFECLRAFSEGWKFHIRGIRFGFGHPSLLVLSILPFLITLALYMLAFYMFILYADDMLRMVWNIEAGESSTIVGWLYWAYTHIVKFFLYLILLVVMFYTFIVFSNVLASPIYDYISTEYEKMYHQTASPEQAASHRKGVLTVIKEEVKKALLMLAIPLPLFFIPVVGTVLGFIVAAVFISWDYTDFSLSRDRPLLKDRIGVVWRHKFILLGFGTPLLIPFLGLMIMPFAIIGSTKLYFDRIKESSNIETLSELGDSGAV